MRGRRPFGRAVGARLRAAIAVLAVLAVAAGHASGGTFGLFTDPAGTSPTVGAARIDITLTTPRGPMTPFSGSGFYPGSSVQQDLALSNRSGSRVAGFRLTTSATSSNLLTSDPTHGLQLTLTRCSKQWSEGKGTFSCDGTTTLVHSGRFLTDTPLTALGNLVDGGTEAHLLITVALPTTADNRFQGLSASLGLAFRAEQVAGRVR